MGGAPARMGGAPAPGASQRRFLPLARRRPLAAERAVERWTASVEQAAAPSATNSGAGPAVICFNQSRSR